ncbi:hypothetical protein NQ317_009555 [Molorchus minor]|uniref:Uncharacterized protein n=1 Tax=Molorchus minor TaxID=1323400 RepID=A0ABQ9JGL9_9CUCU|nr:hypothetical protein NQ317_009555 [Molorchus minor]
MNNEIFLLAVFGFASCGRLDSPYRPPYQRRYSSSIGSGQYSGQYPGPSSQYVIPSSYASQYSLRQQVPILRLEENNNGDGIYNYAYQTGNGITAQEQGDSRGGTRARGSYSYTSPDGAPVQLEYTADENGFQPQGDHLPVAPPIPEAIRKSIQFNLQTEARGIVDDGQYRPGPNEKYGGSQQYDASDSQVYRSF